MASAAFRLTLIRIAQRSHCIAHRTWNEAVKAPGIWSSTKGIRQSIIHENAEIDCEKEGEKCDEFDLNFRFGN